MTLEEKILSLLSSTPTTINNIANFVEEDINKIITSVSKLVIDEKIKRIQNVFYVKFKKTTCKIIKRSIFI